MAEWLSTDIMVRGIKLHYYRTGGNKPPVVLAHGFSDNGLCWTPVARDLEGEYDVVMPDARGHGLSELPESGRGSEAMAADLAGLVQALGLDRPVLMGHSMGAGTAAEVAARYPDLTRGVVLEDPGWRDESSSTSAEEQKARFERMRQDILRYRTMTRDELIADCRARHPNWPEAELGPWADSKLQFNPRVAEVLGGPRQPWQDVARAIACPVLLITADPELGSIVTPEGAREAAALMKQGQVVHIGGAGHSIRREQFGPAMQAVKAFLVQVFA